MDTRIEYDKTNPSSIEAYAQKLIGKTFRDVWEEDEAQQRSDILAEESEEYVSSDDVENKKNKGNLGQIIEENFFHYACNSDSRPDFYEAGVELKVTPYKINKNGSISAKERHCSRPCSSVHGILQARIQEWVAIPFSKGSS